MAARLGARISSFNSTELQAVSKKFEPSSEQVSKVVGHCESVSSMVSSLACLEILERAGFKKLPSNVPYPAIPIESGAAEEIDASILRNEAKSLGLALLQFPAFGGWDRILEENGMVWLSKPHRATCGELNKRLQFWKEDSNSSVDSSFFLSSGVWFSRHTPRLSALASIAFAGIASRWLLEATRKSSAMYVVICVQQYLVAFSLASIAMFLYFGHQKLAKRSVLFMGATLLIFPVLTVILVISGGTQMKKDADEAGVNLVVVLTSAIVGPILCLTAVFSPQNTFATFFWCLFGFLVEFSIFSFIDGSTVFGILGSACAVFVFIVTSYLLLKRAQALRLAAITTAGDAVTYNEVWNKLLETPGYFEAFMQCQARWDDIMRTATVCEKAQDAKNIEVLFEQADLLNPILQHKASAWGAQSNGKHHSSPVKAEERALQKVYRSYGGNWKRLCDLVRTAIVFETPTELAACMNLIARDTDVELIRTSSDKVRLDPRLDVTNYGGYRDIQLSLRLPKAEAYGRHLGAHIIEVQLHIESIYVLKSEGGHSNYKKARNLRCE